MPKKEKLIFPVFLAGVLCLFFWPMIFQGQGYYYGDYKLQFYPWAKLLSDHLKEGSLPLWTRQIGCGFPLLAEGQSAVLYPPHWLLCGLLPFPFSYHAGFIIHFLITAFSTYFFAKECGIGQPGAALAAVVFLFGSAYAGLSYGVMSLRVLAWFPFSLYFVERLVRLGGLRNAAGLAAGLGLGFLGGYPQMALYSLLVVALHFALRLGKAGPRKLAVYFFAAVVLGVGLAACQLLPTLELARESSRAQASIEFALQKSLNPLNILTLLWPGYRHFLGFDFYVGIVPLCLAALAVAREKGRNSRVFLVMAVASFLLALGQFNPLYVLLIRLARVYFLRVPSKFVFYAAFYLAALAGLGLDRLLTNRASNQVYFLKTIRWLFSGAVIIYLGVFGAVRIFKEPIIRFGEWVAGRFIYGKPGHPLPLEDYLQRARESYQGLAQRTGLLDTHFLSVLMVWAILLMFFVLGKREAFKRKTLIVVLVGLTVMDLFFYSFYGTGFRGNQVPARTVSPDQTARFLASAEGRFRTYEMVTDPVKGAPKWLPNSNMLFGYASIGIYSPLATETYRDFLKELGAVDNATGAYATSKEAMKKNLPLLNYLNVRYIASHESLDSISGLKRILTSAGGDFLYENTGYWPRAFWAKPMAVDEGQKTAGVYHEGLRPTEKGIEWVGESSVKLDLRLQTPRDAFLFLSESYYPGWVARLDGRSIPIYKTDKVFRGVQVPKGEHQLTFSFEPGSFVIGCGISLLAFGGCLALALRRGFS